MTDTTTPTRVS